MDGWISNTEENPRREQNAKAPLSDLAWKRKVATNPAPKGKCPCCGSTVAELKGVTASQ